MDFRGKTVLVTGSGNGIGRAIALDFAVKGASHIIIADINLQDARKVENEIRQLGGKAYAVETDVTKGDEVKRLFADIQDQFGGLDILVNNVGTTIRKPIVHFNEQEWDFVVDTCIKSMFLCVVEAGKIMLRQKKGVVLNISSIHGLGGIAGRLPYATSKTAVDSFTKTLACEWAYDGVRVNCIAPGYILTDGMKSTLATGALREEDLVRRTPIGRLGTPEEIAQTCSFLCSDSASFITGTVLYVDGGYAAYHGPEPVPSFHHDFG